MQHINDCFVCGTDNQQGLKVSFKVMDGALEGEFTPNKNHQGPRNLIHGGLICALLDEAMATLINQSLNEVAPTVSLEVRFKRPARINEKLIIKANLTSHERRIKSAQATCEREDGTIVAQATGKFLNSFELA